MLSPFARLILSTSLLSPIIVIYAVLQWFHGGFSWMVGIGFISAILLIVSLWGILQVLVKEAGRFSIRMDKVSSNTRGYFDLVLIYMSSIILADTNFWIFGVLFSFILMVMWSIDLDQVNPFNPLFVIFGYRSYVISYNGRSYLLLSKKSLDSLNDIQTREVVTVSDSFLIEISADRSSSI
jgi:hypothetical protein